MRKNSYPFTAIIGQEPMKKAPAAQLDQPEDWWSVNLRRKRNG